jgi:predicted DNA-binding transcriptional regulator AlpA
MSKKRKVDQMGTADQLLRDHEAAAVLGCSKATLWRRVADGTIPKPVKIGGMSRWPRSEIVTVIEIAKNARER